MDWLNDDRADALDKGRPPAHTSRQGRSGPLLAVLTVLAVLVAGALALWFVLRPDDPQIPEAAPVTSATPAPVQAPASDAEDGSATAAPTPPPSGTASVKPLTGAPLAHAWLRGYLTRPQGQEDTSWITAVEPYSDPDLVDTLRAAEDLGGIGKWDSISVKSIKADTRSHAPSTPTRQISGWIVELTDGKMTTSVPYMITAYIDGDGRWTVALAEQGYTSEG